MMAHDDELLDAIACLALGVLPEAEATALAAHVRACPECFAAYRDFRGSADAVAYAAEVPAAAGQLASARLKARVMQAVRAESAGSGSQPIAPAVPPAAKPDGRNGSPRIPASTPWFAYLAAAAALALAVLTGLDDLSLRAAGRRDAAQLAALRTSVEAEDQLASRARERARTLTDRVAKLTAPGAKHFPIAGGEVIESGGRVLIALRDAPAPPPGKVYQAWTLARGAKTVAPSVTFRPEALGGTTLIELPESAANLAAVAVTVEPAGGSKTPTSKPTFIRPLS